MLGALFTSSTGMKAQQLYVDTIANNLANVNTTGFKKSRIDFQDLLYQTLKAAGSETADGNQVPEGMQVGLGVKPVAISKLFTQGTITLTGNDLDIAIEGDGFFQILQPDGTIAYTRDGSFNLDANGSIVNNDGFVLQPAISVPTNSKQVSIGQDGTVSAILDDGSISNVGQITIATFANPAGLSAQGRNLLLETEASGAPSTGVAGLEGRGTMAQGFLELSNVEIVDELVNMIIAQRAYEVNSRAIRTADEMLQIANQLR
ncbi:MAG: flagellar basal-body rod protein FlgG [Candidatus Auribacterota bacterium]|jgi:flagellar basal-body rod protein FlgG|uniref:Flagellar basal-body rod protein FlgG n=1 Tax=Candidatus Auribacter fodinae TaxID=2093366 RepID=A0A3A4R5V5_9BACT|nr:MAG: flagellar basal-body rod protein FlgG [Candidatus Auribacter fodinae]